jgi:hypothetical protein
MLKIADSKPGFMLDVNCFMEGDMFFKKYHTVFEKSFANLKKI